MSFRSLLIVVAIAVGLTVLFWGPLWEGHGLIGGDLYTYFFPQKLYYAEQIAEGRIPLWNDLVGFGYPFLAESQAGVFYPPNPVLYRSFDVNTAYNVSQLGHYVLAFIFTWLLLRRLDLRAAAATLGAVVFVYGWFPPRICLEWAIIGGVYFPLSLWCVESYLQSRKRRWLVLLAISQGIHLLAGHFNLAFITQLTCVAYAGCRVSAFGCRQDAENATPECRHPNAAAVALVTLAIGIGFALAAVQILPTWELKQLSQRDGIGSAHDPGYGHIPPWYLSQIVAPWFWYPLDVDPDQALQSIRTLTIASATNKVEAHIYFGMLPLLLIGYRLIAALRGDTLDRRHRLWLWLGLAALIYATGWLLPITRHLPGFSFFMGPGRYGIVTTFAAALLAGAGLDRLLMRWRFRSALIGIVIGLAVADLIWVSRRVTYAVMVEDPPILHVEESEVRRILTAYEEEHGSEQAVRMLAPGPNLPTLTGFAAYPSYLGIGPAAYYDPDLMMPEPKNERSEDQRSQAIMDRTEWLKAAAITHVLSMDPLDSVKWPFAHLIWTGRDRLLNPAWGRAEPLYLYELEQRLPRVRLINESAENHVVVFEDSPPDLISIHSRAAVAGKLTVASLEYPGWRVMVRQWQEDRSGWSRTDASVSAGMFLSTSVPAGESRVVFHFESTAVHWGRVVSGLAWFSLLAGVLLVSVRPRTTRSDDTGTAEGSP